MTEAGIPPKLLRKYLDDVLVVCRKLKLGSRLIDGEVKWSQEWEDNDAKDGVT